MIKMYADLFSELVAVSTCSALWLLQILITEAEGMYHEKRIRRCREGKSRLFMTDCLQRLSICNSAP